MKIIFAILILIAICFSVSGQLLIAVSGSQVQSVSGDFGRTWINNYLAQKPKPVENNLSNNLWNWGTSPKGKVLVGGKLVDTSQYLYPLVNFSANWLGDISRAPPLYLNSSNPYGNYGMNAAGYYNAAPLTPLALSDDPWVLAQQLERPVVTPAGYFTPSI